MELSRVRYTVTGRVQGVGFRYFTRSAARTLGLTGWVRNCGDGSVQLEAQGTAEALAQLAAHLRRGPDLGHVSNLTAQPCPVRPDETGFQITG